MTADKNVRATRRLGLYSAGMPNPPIAAAAIILAAGDSSRMGKPKALLDWQGKPLIEHVISVAREGGCTKVFAILGKDAAAVRAGAKLDGVTVLVNPHPEQGQVSSTRLGMENLDFSTDCCIVWPVDCPLVHAADVRALIDTYAKTRASLMRILMPVHKGERGHPMLVDIGFRQPFMELKEGETARKVIEDNHTQVREVPTDNLGVLIDIDTPEEYRSALGT